MDLTSYQLTKLLNRFPAFELSYETMMHKKVCTDYNIVYAIPLGKKYYVWYTFHRNQDVCYLLELSKDKVIVKGTCITTFGDQQFSLGTLLYGTFLEEQSHFIVEDIYYYQGVPLKQLQLKERMYIQKEMFETINKIKYNKKDIHFYLPYFWRHKEQEEFATRINTETASKIGYEVHHLQYRSLYVTIPYINITITKKLQLGPSKEKSIPTQYYKKYTFDFTRPQHKFSTVFLVNPDLQNDVYHLYAFGKHKANVYYNIAYIPNYKKSVYMNSLFRNIRENKNLDYIEESEDEEDFQNIALDKHVDLTKFLPMECVFLRKFKKWVPMKVADKFAKVVHINKLVSDYYQ